MNSAQEDTNIVHLAEGFFLQEREDGTFALLEEDEVVAEGNSVDEALDALQVSLELRLVSATMAWLDAIVPEDGIWS
tara:strand:- start:161 stop:391 length:231 start_codon:yes stop_codon:yes gene_type:complete